MVSSLGNKVNNTHPKQICTFDCNKAYILKAGLMSRKLPKDICICQKYFAKFLLKGHFNSDNVAGQSYQRAHQRKPENVMRWNIFNIFECVKWGPVLSYKRGLMLRGCTQSNNCGKIFCRGEILREHVKSSRATVRKYFAGQLTMESGRIGSGGRGATIIPSSTPLLSLSHDDHTPADVHEHLSDDDDGKTIEKDRYLFC